MGLLYERSFSITDDVILNIPTVGDVIDHQDDYYRTLSAFISTPTDLMVQLADMGIDFTTINKYQLFAMLFRGVLEDYQGGNTAGLDLLFTGYDFNNLFAAIDMQTEKLMFVDRDKRIIIDERIYRQTRSALCYINDIEKKDKVPGNEAAKQYMLERARVKQERARRKSRIGTDFEDCIVALVNTKDFKYDFDSVKNLSLYQFNRSLQQIMKRINYDQIMSGYYAGTLDIKKVDQKELNWLSSNKQ